MALVASWVQVSGDDLVSGETDNLLLTYFQWIVCGKSLIKIHIRQCSAQNFSAYFDRLKIWNSITSLREIAGSNIRTEPRVEIMVFGCLALIAILGKGFFIALNVENIRLVHRVESS